MRRWVAHAIKPPNSWKAFNQPFLRKVRGCSWQLPSLRVRSFVPEVAGHGQVQCSTHLYQTNEYSLTRKGKVQVQFHPPESCSWLRRQISAGGSRRTGPRPCPAVSTGGQPSNPARPRASGHQAVAQTGLGPWPRQTARCSYFWDRQVQRFLLLQAWAEEPGVALVWTPGAHRKQIRPVPWASAHSLSQGQETSWRARGKRPGLHFFLLTPPADQHSASLSWTLSRKVPQWAVGCLWAGPLHHHPAAEQGH